MSIKDELAAELREAMRSGDTARRNVIRQVETEIAMAKSAPGFGGEPDDELYRAVIGSYVKKMRKAIDEYRQIGERGEAMAETLGFEVEYLSRWLPRTLGEEETRRLVREAITDLDVAGDPQAAGRVTGHLMKSRRDELDGQTVNRIVREELGAG